MLNWRASRGSAVAEFVVILPALLLVVSILLSGLAAMTLQIRCRETAASIARAIERGEPESTWRALALRTLPASSIHLRYEGRVLLVQVTHPFPPHSPITMYVRGEAGALP